MFFKIVYLFMVMVWLSYYIYRSCFLIIHPLTSLFAEPYKCHKEGVFQVTPLSTAG